MFNNMDILDARFANPSEDTIAVLYKDESGENVETYVQVNENDATYKALVEAGYSKEVIKEKTTEAKRMYMRNVYNTLRERHPDQLQNVLDDFELEKQEKQEEINTLKEEINKLDETLDLKRQQILITFAALEAIRKENNIKLHNEKV